MTAEGAIAAAEAEGLTLLRAENTAGFKHVSVQNSNAIRPFRAQKDMGAARAHIGDFATAEEAALAVARFLRSSVTPPAPPAAARATADDGGGGDRGGDGGGSGADPREQPRQKIDDGLLRRAAQQQPR